MLKCGIWRQQKDESCFCCCCFCLRGLGFDIFKKEIEHELVFVEIWERICKALGGKSYDQNMSIKVSKINKREKTMSFIK